MDLKIQAYKKPGNDIWLQLAVLSQIYEHKILTDTKELYLINPCVTERRTNKSVCPVGFSSLTHTLEKLKTETLQKSAYERLKQRENESLRQKI